ncbi:MAG: AAA family ATPase, partial [Bacteroidota bacterium]|nr:AAA family ATPase [Bacteroidota bacterium]
ISMGGTHLFVDEVHKYPNWSVEIKNIYDYYKGLKVVFTGSSLLEILNSRSDLSRRALVFKMQGMSFREYLNFYYKTDFKVVEFGDLLENHLEIALGIGKNIKPLKYFPEYLRVGYFPFYKQSEEWYFMRLQEIINMIIEIELPLLRRTDISIISKIKLLLYVISQNVPFRPNISALASKIGSTRKTILEYLNYLSDANVLNSLYKDSIGVGILQKPDKLFLENTNFAYSIASQEPNVGNLRETFFLNQLSQAHKVNYSDKGDFLVDNKFIFEVGGKSKDYSQIAKINHSYIASDNIEFGIGNKIPLWLFGFLY